MGIKKRIGVLVICLVVFSLLLVGVISARKDKDTKKDDIKNSWAKDYINEMVKSKAMDVKPDGLFHPSSNITRAEFVKALLVSSLGGDPGANSEGYWADTYISLATYKGIIKAGEFTDTEQKITRVEAARMIARTLNQENKAQTLSCQITGFKDDDSIFNINKGYVKVVNEYGIIKGLSNSTFTPNGSITRAEAAKIIVSTLKVKSELKPDDSKYVQKEVNENGIVADFFYNKEATNQKVIVLLGGSEGGKSWSGELDTQTRLDLLKRGYAILSLAYFGMDGVSPTLESIPLEYFKKPIDWALNQPGMDKKGATVMGVSKGGEASLLIASYFPEKVNAVIGIVPSSNVFQGFGEGGIPNMKDTVKSSWSYDGKDIPFAPFINNSNYQKSLELLKKEQKLEFVNAYNDALEDKNNASSSSIALEKANCPILLISGKRIKCGQAMICVKN